MCCVLCELRESLLALEWCKSWGVGQLSLIKKSHRKNVVESNSIESLHKIAHMQVGQCGNQEAHAEVLCRGRRVVRAIATRANL